MLTADFPLYLDPRRSSSNSKFAEGQQKKGNYEASVMVYWCQPQILTNKHDRVTITTTSSIYYQLLLTTLQKRTHGSVLHGIRQMTCIVLTLDWADLPQALIFCSTTFVIVYVWWLIGWRDVIYLHLITICITLSKIESCANCEYLTYKMGFVLILLGL